MLALVKKISALKNAHRFNAFLNGVNMQLPDGENLFVKVVGTKGILYPAGLRFSKHAFRSEVQAGDILEVGYGEDDSKLLAYEKSISEAIERVVFRVYKAKGLGIETSSGWSAHLTKELAKEAAFEELAERDALMAHWLLKAPMIQINPLTFPKFIKNFVTRELVLHNELISLRLLATFDCYCPTVTAVLQTKKGSSIISHGTAPTLLTAYRKAMSEACRMASNLELRHFFDSSKGLSTDEASVKINAEDHGMYYAFHNNLPSWLYGEIISWSNAESQWKKCVIRNKNRKNSFRFTEIIKSPLSIGYAESPEIQKLYLGSTAAAVKNGRISFSRLNVVGGLADLNMMPHFIS